jgi:N-acetylmuramoyl-L-alanine amidase
MFGSDILDVAIGLVFVYLLLSLICSIVNEGIAAFFSMRATNLEDGIRNLLTGSPNQPKDGKDDIAKELYNHALIFGLFKQDWLDKLRDNPGRPSYIPSRTFALALLDTVAPSPLGTPQSIQDIRQAIDDLPEGHTRQALLTLINNAQEDLQKLRQNVENWYNDSMDRVSGWYKRKSQLILLGLAIIVAVAVNADSISIVNTLIHDPVLRASAVTAAQEQAKKAPDNLALGEVESKLGSLHLPLGWVGRPADKPNDNGDPRYFPLTFSGILTKFLGLLLTALALSLGAPFWFDILNKFIVVRSTVKPREKSQDERSKDNTSDVQATRSLVAQDGATATMRSASAETVEGSPAISAAAASAAAMVAFSPAPPLVGAAARTGADLVNFANEHLKEEYIFGSLVPMNNADWHGPWDCAEFVSWCVYQLVGKLYGCQNDNDDPAHTDAYTGWWGRDAGTVLKRITVKEATNTPGAILLRLPQSHMTGHIVISDGTGGTVEAHSHKDGVVNLQVANRRWDLGILIPELNYTVAGAISLVPPSNVYRLTSPFMTGSEVRQIQQQLRAQGVDPGPLDGIYGPKTAAAVYSFQMRNGLVADGEAGPTTRAALIDGTKPITPTPPTQSSFPGIDMGGYPGDEVMRRIFKDPYVFTGYYLKAPCHRDKPVGPFEPWMGNLQKLKEIGWGLVVVYVGQQAVESNSCDHNALTRSQGELDGTDAIQKAMGDNVRNDATIFLDVERVDVMPDAMIEYVRGWFAKLLSDGNYRPGIYCHGKNAEVLFSAAQQEYNAHGHSGETPPFWVVRIKEGFDLNSSVPADSGTSFAAVWQGKIDIKNERHGDIRIDVDHNVATTENPSNA